MSEVEFEVQEGGTPQLVGEEEKPPEPDQGYGTAAAEASVVGWTAAEASGFVASIFTTGMAIAFVVRKTRLPGENEWPHLVAAKEEFPLSGQGLCPLLNRFLPRDAGGGLVAAGAGLLGMVGEVAMAAARRGELLRKEIRTAPAFMPPDASEEAPAPAPSGTGDSQKFKFSREFADVLPGQAPMTTAPRI